MGGIVGFYNLEIMSLAQIYPSVQWPLVGAGAQTVSCDDQSSREFRREQSQACSTVNIKPSLQAQRNNNPEKIFSE